jgi:hypothetical protein
VLPNAAREVARYARAQHMRTRPICHYVTWNSLLCRMIVLLALEHAKVCDG